MTPKSIWVPKTHVYRSKEGLAWIRKDRQFIRSLAGHEKTVVSKQYQQKPTIKTTKVWVPKQKQHLYQKPTDAGHLTDPHTVHLVLVKDWWMSFIRHQQGYIRLPTGPGDGEFNAKP